MRLPRISIQLVGSALDGEHVRLSEFVEQLERVREALKETEQQYSGDEASKIYYRIVDLSHSSPATVTLEAVSPGMPEEYSQAVVKRFGSELSILASRKRPKSASVSSLRAYRDIGKPLERHVNKLVIQPDAEEPIEIQRDFVELVDSLMGYDQAEYGTITGRMEVLDLHRKQRFSLYPLVGPRKVVGTFSSKDKARFLAGIDKTVTIHGTLYYKDWSPFPHTVNATDIDVHPEDHTLPSAISMRGVAPGMTGDEAIEEFVTRIRDDWRP